jgi:hypothetical protein
MDRPIAVSVGPGPSFITLLFSHKVHLPSVICVIRWSHHDHGNIRLCPPSIAHDKHSSFCLTGSPASLASRVIYYDTCTHNLAAQARGISYPWALRHAQLGGLLLFVFRGQHVCKFCLVVVTNTSARALAPRNGCRYTSLVEDHRLEQARSAPAPITPWPQSKPI